MEGSVFRRPARPARACPLLVDVHNGSAGVADLGEHAALVDVSNSTKPPILEGKLVGWSRPTRRRAVHKRGSRAPKPPTLATTWRSSQLDDRPSEPCLGRWSGLP